MCAAAVSGVMTVASAREMGLTIGIDARAAAEVPAGRGRYVRQLLKALQTLPEASDDSFALFAREPWDDLDSRFRWELIDLPDPLWHLMAARRASRRCDVFLSTNSYLTAWFTTVPTAIVIHDLVPFAKDAHAQSRAAAIERATIRPALRRAQAFPCVSSATRDDLVKGFPATAPKTTVIPLAAADHFSRAVPSDAAARHGLNRPYVLAVGTLEPRKNLERLLIAWSRLPPSLRDSHALALVGPRGWDDSRIVEASREVGAHLLGKVGDDDLAALYAGCACFAYPSLYEGFGLPVLEAMSAGAPVLTSNVSSLPEVAGESALLVDPFDTRAIADALERILSDPDLARHLSKCGRQRASGFSWENTARQTLQVMKEIGGCRRT